ncbi:MAG TPA: tRNA (adenosine(37)-N6)-dimethylallyltransferase MiaA, partial [Chthonomonadales bacterium]|nr:tRNA (adenosine(37)-N6)-dimethylallyltransferase MiaA [Chthonomonadales bacterium]
MIANSQSQREQSEPLLVVLHGATASGKTSLAVQLAERFSGEIVSCDSVAVYREFEIGTAKPSREERTRAPHHMLDAVTPDQPYTAGDYARDARSSLAAIVARGNLPIVAGGTGLYLRALIDGLFPGPQRFESLRVRLREMEKERGSGYLARILQRLDPVSADRIHPNDAPKLVRAIEVTLAARQPMSALWEAGRDPLQGFRILRLGLDPPRSALYARINRRAADMFSDGLVEETERLLARYSADCRPLASLGYKQAAMLLRGDLSLEHAIASTQQGHRNYAKRQTTWFRREP